MLFVITNGREDFRIEATSDNVQLNRNNVGGLNLSFKEGLCRADVNVIVRPRTGRKDYYERFLLPLVKRGEISDGSYGLYDDRKLRLYETRINKNQLEISLGITTFQEFKADERRSAEENRELQERGLKDFDDRFAFFSRAIGVAAVVISKGGSVFLGERQGQEDEGWLNSAAGYVSYKENMMDIDFGEDARREVLEELGVKSDEIKSLEFVGVYSHASRGDVDFSYLAFTNLDDDYFVEGGWKERIEEREHGYLIKLDSYHAIHRLLYERKLSENGDRRWNVMYSTRGALMSLETKEIGN